MGREPNSGFKRESGNRLLPQKYYFLFEGANTEPQYFNCLYKYRNDDAIQLKKTIEILSLRKFGPEYNQTNILAMLDIADSYRSFFNTKECDLSYFVSVVLDPIRIDMYYNKDAKLDSIRNRIVNTLINDGTCNTGRVTKENYSQVLEKCKKIALKKHPKYKKNLDLEIKEEWINPNLLPKYDGDYCKFYVVRDRDYMCKVLDEDFELIRFDDDMYDEALNKAKSLNIQLAISTPAFEYWLLLHHVDDDFGKKLNKHKKSIIQNRLDVIENRRSPEDFDNNWYDRVQLSENQSKKLKIKQKAVDDKRFTDYYLHGFRKAIERSKVRTSDIVKLRDECGTNLGDIFSELIQ